MCRIRPLILRVAPSGLLRSFDGWNFYDEAVIVIIGGGGRELHCARLPLSLPRRNATRLYRKWFLKEGKTEGGHFGRREGVGYRESHLQTNKILGREGGRGGMKCQEWRLRMSILDLPSSRPTIRSCNKDGIPRTNRGNTINSSAI